MRMLGRYVEAIPVFERVLALDAGHTHTLSGLADAAMQCCDWQSVRRDRAGAGGKGSGGKPRHDAVFIPVCVVIEGIATRVCTQFLDAHVPTSGRDFDGAAQVIR